MYTLLSGLWRYMLKKDEYFVLIVGLDNAGKTTFLETAKTKLKKKFKGVNLSRITTTVGLNIGKIDVNGVKLSFWDLGGQEELQSLWDKYYAEAHAIIYVIDGADKDRLMDSKAAFESMGVREVKPVFIESAHLIGKRDCMVMPVCALNGDGVDEGVRWLVQCIKKNRDIRPPSNKQDF